MKNLNQGNIPDIIQIRHNVLNRKEKKGFLSYVLCNMFYGEQDKTNNRLLVLEIKPG